MTMTNEFQLMQKLKRDDEKIQNTEEVFRASTRFIVLAYQEISKNNKHILALRTVNNTLKQGANSLEHELDLSNDLFESAVEKQQLSASFKKQIKDMLAEDHAHQDGLHVTIAGQKRIKLDLKDQPLELREQQLITNFLKRFLLNSHTNSGNGDNINLKMALKALPFFMDRHNIYKVDLINFQKVQQALIWFVNDDQDEMFNYYDNRNIQRINEITQTNRENEDIMTKILKSSAYLNHYFQWKEKGGKKSSSSDFYASDEPKQKKRVSNFLEVEKPPLIMGAPEAENGIIAEQVKYNNLMEDVKGKKKKGVEFQDHKEPEGPKGEIQDPPIAKKSKTTVEKVEQQEQIPSITVRAEEALVHPAMPMSTVSHQITVSS